MSKSLISNPPYNLQWDIPCFAQLEPRFIGYDIPPKSNANFAFVLSALEKIDAKAVLVLPCSILSSDVAQESSIRQQLIENNFIEAIIICPNEMFEATTISTCVLILSKIKTNALIEFIDLREKYEVEVREQRGQQGGFSHTNRMYEKKVKIITDATIEDVLDSIKHCKNIVGFCKSATIENVKANKYSLIPSKYVDFEIAASSHRGYDDILNDLNRVIKQKNCCKLIVNEKLAKTLGFDIELYKNDHLQDDVIDKLVVQLTGEKIEKTDYFQLTKNKNEMEFRNNSKDEISSVLLMILQTWKQHIHFLNTEENRYLVEMRDALLPELMSGKIAINTEESEGKEDDKRR